MPNEAVLEQSRFVPGWLHIRHGASTEKLYEIGLMRMPGDERCDTCVEDVRADAESCRDCRHRRHSTNTEHHVMRCEQVVKHAD